LEPELLEPSLKGRSINRTVEDKRRNDRVITQSGDESRCFPVAVRHVVDQSRAFLAASPQSRHLRVGARLVDEDQLLRVESGLSLSPLLTRCGDVGPQLLAGVQSFF